MSIRNNFILLLSKTAGRFISLLKIGTGSTWPGHIALFLNKNFIRETLPSRLKIVLIAGTNGKTTTTSVLTYILKKQGLKVFHNEEGANLLNGIASAIIRNYRFDKHTTDTAIFEIDENTLPQILSQISPNAVVLLNLFRDQLDRYGEVNTLSENWLKSLQHLSPETHVFLNADDPRINYLGIDLKAQVSYFGLPEKFMSQKNIPHDVDSVYCPKCSRELVYKKMSYSHLGDYECPNCHYKRTVPETFDREDFTYSLLGLYNIYNIHAAVLVAHQIFEIPIGTIKRHLSRFQPVFGRQESLNFRDKDVLILLSKNPTGFNQTIEVVKNSIRERCTILIILNDRIPDGLDISWIWDVEFEELVAEKKVRKIIVSGDRTYDMALRFLYTESNKNVQPIDDLEKAINLAVQVTKAGEKIIIMATYSGMLEARKILLGRKLS